MAGSGGAGIPVTGGSGLPAQGAGNGVPSGGGKPPKNPQGMPQPRVVAPKPVSIKAQPRSSPGQRNPGMHQVKPPGGGGGRGRGPGIPNPLAPLSGAQINQQAINTITKAYNPAVSDLNYQQTREQAVADKRSSDNKYYLSWLDTQMSGLQAHAEAAQNALVTAMGPQGANSLHNAAPGVPGTPGVNGSPGTPGTPPPAQTSYGDNAIPAAQNPYGAGINDQFLNGVRANNFAYVAAMSSKQQSDLQTALGTIGQARTKLNLAKTGDIAKEIGRLQGVEIQKAQSNRNFDALTTKLGIAQSAVQAGVYKSTLASKTSLANTSARDQTSLANTNSRNQTSLANTNSRNQTSLANTNARDNTSTANNAANNATRQSIAAANRAAKASGVASPRDAAAIYKGIDTISGQVKFLQANGYRGAAAWHVINDGGSVRVQVGPGPITRTTSSTGKVSTHQGAPVYHTYSYKNPGTEILNAGFSAAGKGLTAGDEAWLTSKGLNPNRYADAPDPLKPGPTGSTISKAGAGGSVGL